MPADVLDPPAAEPAPKYHPDELFTLPDGGRGLELVDDELVERQVSTLSSLTASEINHQLRGHVKPRGLGWVVGENASFRCFPAKPGQVRRADVAFTRLDRLSAEQAVRRGHCPVCPDLVVEVVSPGDAADDVNAKRQEWLAAGAGLVWVVYPLVREVYAYTAAGGRQVFGPADVLTADPLLPDFRVPVADLFALPGPAVG